MVVKQNLVLEMAFLIIVFHSILVVKQLIIEFKKDKKALLDQGEGEGTNSFLSSLNSSSSNSSGSVLTFSTSQALDLST